MSTAIPPTADPTTSAAKKPPPASPSELLREGVRKHLIPANTVIGFGLVLVSLADLLAPRIVLGVTVLRNLALILATGMLIAIVMNERLDRWVARLGFDVADQDKRRWLKPRRWILPLLLLGGALTLTLSQAKEGGVIASRVASLKAIQNDVLDLQDDVRAVGAGVDRANQTLDTMVRQEQALQAGMAAAPLSVGLLDLQGAGAPARPHAPWPARLAVHLNESGHDIARMRLILAHGGSDPTGQRRSPDGALGQGTSPSAVQLPVTLPATTRWVSVCLVLPPTAPASRQALAHRWHATPQADGLLLQADGAARLTHADDAACVL